MSPRPAPEYGEYATPEEVAAITGRPMPEAAPRAPESAAPAAAASEPTASEPPRTHPDEVDPATPGAAARPRLARPVWDSAVAVAFLASGVWYGVTALVDPHAFGAALQANAERMGWSGSVGGPVTDAVGLALAIGMTVLVILVAAITWSASRRLRRIWWIPACGAVLSIIANLTGTAIALAAHPGFLSFVSSGG